MYTNRALLLAVLLTVPVVASASVVTAGLPPVSGFSTAPTDSAASAKKASDATATATTAVTKSQYVVPAIHLSFAAREAIAAQKVWQQSIAPPPEGKESAATAALARESLAVSRKVDTTPPVIGGSNGAILSVGGRPVLVCSPLHTCVIALPAGTHPVTTVGTKPSEWRVQQAMVGKQPEVFLSPKFAGLHQNIVIAAAGKNKNAVNYQVRIVSDKNRYVPELEIVATAGQTRTWTPSQLSEIRIPHPAGVHQKTGQPDAVLPLPLVPVSAIRTNWSIHCGGGGWFSASDCAAIRPLRVYDDGTHTFIQMPAGLASHGGFPIVQAFDHSGKQIGMDTQIRGHLIVLDSVPNRIKLLLGHEVVNIHRGDS